MKIPSIGKTEALILTALLPRERYGLEIISKVKEISDGRVEPSLGGLYTTLHRMEEKGLIEGRWGETTTVRQGARRRYYSVSGLGIRALKDTTQLYKAVVNFNPASAVNFFPAGLGAL